MRKLLIRLAILIVVIVVGAVIWLGMNANSLVAKHRGDIENALSETLKTKVTLGGISATVFPKTALQITDLNLGGGVSLSGVSLKISPMALLSGTIKINELSINDPAIVLTQNDSGFAVKGLPAPASGAAPTTQEKKTETTPNSSAAASTSSPVTLALDSFALRNGSVTLEMKAPAKSMVVKDINVTSGLNVSGSTVTLSGLSCSLSTQGITGGASAKQIKLDGATSSINTSGFVLNSPAGDIQVDLDFANPTSGTGRISTAAPLSLGKVAPIVSQVAPNVTNLGGNVKLNLNAKASGADQYSHNGEITLSSISASVAPYDVTGLGGLIRINGDANKLSASSGSVVFGFNGQPLDVSFAAGFNKSENSAYLSRLDLKGFGGAVTAQANAVLTNGGPIKVSFDASNLAVKSLLSIMKNPALSTVTGSIQKISANITTENGSAMMNKVSGTANFDVRDGSIPGVNVIGPVLKDVMALPFFAGKKGIPANAQAAADSKDTAFKSITGTVQITNGTAQTNDLSLLSQLFDLKATGSFTTAGAVNLKASIFLEPGLSAAISGGEGKKILNKEGRLEVPLSISGTPQKISVTPDVSRLLNTAAGKALEESASKLLGKAFGGKKGDKKGGGLFGF